MLARATFEGLAVGEPLRNGIPTLAAALHVFRNIYFIWGVATPLLCVCRILVLSPSDYRTYIGHRTSHALAVRGVLCNLQTEQRSQRSARHLSSSHSACSLARWPLHVHRIQYTERRDADRADPPRDRTRLPRLPFGDAGQTAHGRRARHVSTRYECR